MATWYKTDGSVSTVVPADGKAFTLDELRKFVGDERGDIVQFVPLANGESMVINDEGKLIGLPKNEIATAVWKKAYPISQYPHNNDELIVGNALVATEKELGNEEEEETPCSHGVMIKTPFGLRCPECGYTTKK